MATKVLTAREFADFHRKLGRNLGPAAKRGIMSGAARCIPFLVRQTRKAPPANPSGIGTGGAVNTGDFIRRWRAVETSGGARLLNDHPAAKVIELGRRPGSKPPPIAPIAAWVMRRLSGFRPASFGKKVVYPLGPKQYAKIASRYNAARSVAFAIAKSIGKRGLLGRRILTSDFAKQKILEFVRAETIRELTRSMRETR